jgi:ATP-dependent RNA helicase MSS116
MYVAASTLSPVHEYISTVSDADIATHKSVTQTFSLTPRKDRFAALTSLLATKLVPQLDAKAIIILPTAWETQVWGALLEAVLKQANVNPALRLAMYVMHSRLSQKQRDKAKQDYRDATKGVMFASDVLALGIDIQGVTHVIQIGLPQNNEQCKSSIHYAWALT